MEEQSTHERLCDLYRVVSFSEPETQTGYRYRRKEALCRACRRAKNESSKSSKGAICMAVCMHARHRAGNTSIHSIQEAPSATGSQAGGPASRNITGHALPH